MNTNERSPVTVTVNQDGKLTGKSTAAPPDPSAGKAPTVRSPVKHVGAGCEEPTRISRHIQPVREDRPVRESKHYNDHRMAWFDKAVTWYSNAEITTRWPDPHLDGPSGNRHYYPQQPTRRS